MARSGGMERDKDNLSGGVRADLIEEICKRLEPYLPIKSLEDLSKKVDEIQVGSHTIPLKLIAPHVGKDAFPVKDARDLRGKVIEGVERAVSLARSPGVGANAAVFHQAVGELTQTEAKIGLMRPAVLRIYYPD